MNLADSIFYHIYPLGALGVLNGERIYGMAMQGAGATEHIQTPQYGSSPLLKILDWIASIKQIKANSLYLGPLFESEWHGYETVDHRRVDSRLGNNDDLRTLSASLRDQGISLVLDAVFNHVGRSHPIVLDVVENGSASRYSRWISGYNPNQPSPGGLPFSYDTWAGHLNLVRLDTSHPEVQEFLIETALYWIDEFDIVGLRLDAADSLDTGFLARLAAACREKRTDFFLIGEAVHGENYSRLLTTGKLSSVTNYEAYKGLWSSYNDRNYFEISWTLDRLFGENGICRGFPLYSFADNHDVDRVASVIRKPAGLYPLYGLLFSMPGIPSVYYGSEYGIPGRKGNGDDSPLRPELDPFRLPVQSPQPQLANAITRFSEARHRTQAIRSGGYRLLHVESQGLVFIRTLGPESVIIGINGSDGELNLKFRASELAGKNVRDILDSSYGVRLDNGGNGSMIIPSNWTRWLCPVR